MRGIVLVGGKEIARKGYPFHQEGINDAPQGDSVS